MDIEITKIVVMGIFGVFLAPIPLVFLLYIIRKFWIQE